MRRKRRKRRFFKHIRVKIRKSAAKPAPLVPVRSRKTKVEPKPIEEIARSIGIKKKYIEHHGRYRAKISLVLLNALKKKKVGKYVLISSITPSPLGEGKTVTTIGLSMAFKRLKKKAISCIAQPSLSGIFGMKGTGSGTGLAQVLPAEDANLHLAGDIHAVEYAQNLCATYLDNSIFNGNPLDIDLDSITWRRTIDASDRSLRNISIGLGGKADGVQRKTGFDTTGASELMAILSLASDIKDLRERIGRAIVGFNKKGKPVTCNDIKVAGTMTAILKNALKPNLLQTTEHTACFVHGGSFGNVSLGATSVVADRIALRCADYVIAETGFGADMGAEKFFDIKCRVTDIKPDVAVIVCTVRALKMHSGDIEMIRGRFPKEVSRENVSAVERGLSNLEKQIDNLRTFGIPVIVCINRFSDDTEKEIQAIKKRAMILGANAVTVSNVRSSGGEGGVDLAHAIIEACKIKHSFRFLYPLDIPLKDKIRRIAKTIYGAKEVTFSEEANKKVLMLKKLKLDNLPVCIAKTHLSLSHNPKRKARPHGFKFPIEELRLCSGAGFITAISDHIKTMPGLPKVPRGTKIDIDEEGRITGLF